MDIIRLKTLENEKRTISPYGMLCSNTKGREREEDECEIRSQNYLTNINEILTIQI